MGPAQSRAGPQASSGLPARREALRRCRHAPTKVAPAGSSSGFLPGQGAEYRLRLLRLRSPRARGSAVDAGPRGDVRRGGAVQLRDDARMLVFGGLRAQRRSRASSRHTVVIYFFNAGLLKVLESGGACARGPGARHPVVAVFSFFLFKAPRLQVESPAIPRIQSECLVRRVTLRSSPRDIPAEWLDRRNEIRHACTLVRLLLAR